MNVCTLIEKSYGDLGAVTGTAFVAPADEDRPMAEQKLTLQIPLNQDAKPDILFIELWEDAEPFIDSGFMPITLTLNGDQADVLSCGACVYIAADFESVNNINFNMTYTGELVLEVVDATPGSGQVKGSLTDIMLREVTTSAEGQEPVENGCRSELAGVQFDFSVVTDPPPPAP
jgi:hypothetical protein